MSYYLTCVAKQSPVCSATFWENFLTNSAFPFHVRYHFENPCSLLIWQCFFLSAVAILLSFIILSECIFLMIWCLIPLQLSQKIFLLVLLVCGNSLLQRLQVNSMCENVIWISSSYRIFSSYRIEFLPFVDDNFRSRHAPWFLNLIWIMNYSFYRLWTYWISTWALIPFVESRKIYFTMVNEWVLRITITFWAFLRCYFFTILTVS